MEQLFFVFLWSFVVSVCVPLFLFVSDITIATLSVWLSFFLKILIISPPSLLALAVIDRQTSAGKELGRWLKWQNKNRDEERTEPAHQVHKRQGLSPSPFLFKSQRLIPRVNHRLSNSSLSHCSLASLSYFILTPSNSALWVIRG